MEKFKINNSYSSPENINYDIRGLYKFEYIEMINVDRKGELYKVEYYRNFNSGDPNDIHNYSDLILVENRVYTRQPVTNLLFYRVQTVQWYLTDNTIGCTKVSTKTYQFKDAIDEGKARRDNIITATKGYLMSHIGLANGQILLAELSDDINIYIQGNHQPLIDAINASAEGFMTPTIKAMAVSILTF